jgi:tetratricopeptide (TPR) repeat protein
VFAAGFPWRQGDAERGKEFCDSALAIYDELGTSGHELGRAYSTSAVCELSLGNRERALELYELAAAMARADGDERSVAAIVNNLGNVALDERDFTRARTYFEESVAIGRRLRMRSSLANSLVDLGFVALAEAHVEEATASFREALDMCAAGQLAADVLVWAMEGLAAVALERAAPVEATRLLAATTRPRKSWGSPRRTSQSEKRCGGGRSTSLARCSARPRSLRRGSKAKRSP